jgi:hypothetical protein
VVNSYATVSLLVLIWADTRIRKVLQSALRKSHQFPTN